MTELADRLFGPEPDGPVVYDALISADLDDHPRGPACRLLGHLATGEGTCLYCGEVCPIPKARRVADTGDVSDVGWYR